MTCLCFSRDIVFHGTPFFLGGSKVDAQMYGSYEGFALDVLFRLVIFKM